MKKRTIVLIVLFSILGIILLISALRSEFVVKEGTCLVGISEESGCNCEDTGTFLGCPQFGFKCDSKLLNCTWYPLFFGCVDSVPTCFGFSCGTFGVAPESGAWVSEGVLNSEHVYRDIVEGVDYTIDNITYTVTTPKGTYTATTFDEMLSSDPVKKYSYISGLKEKNVFIKIEINLTALSPIEKLGAYSTVYYAGIYEELIGGNTATHYGRPLNETATGKTSLVIDLKLDATELGSLKRLESITIEGKVGEYRIVEGE